MSEMVKRVADAIEPALRRQIHEFAHDCDEIARIAIAAMREPTDSIAMYGLNATLTLDQEEPGTVCAI